MVTLTLTHAQMLRLHQLLHTEALKRNALNCRDEAIAVLNLWIEVDQQLHAWETAA